MDDPGPQPLRFFNSDLSAETHRRNLPHWYRSGIVAFTTFRLADSIPQAALEEWDAQRRIWLLHRLNSAEGDIDDLLLNLTEEDRREYLRRFGTRFHELLDTGHGSCLLVNPNYSAIVETALLYFDGARYQLGDYVVMPNHVHALLVPTGNRDMGEIVGSWKKFTARRINAMEAKSGALWQHESFDHLVRSGTAMEKFRRYIQENPLRWEKDRHHPKERR